MSVNSMTSHCILTQISLLLNSFLWTGGTHRVVFVLPVVAGGPWGTFVGFKTYKALTHTNKFGQCCFYICEHCLTRPISGSFHTSHFINLWGAHSQGSQGSKMLVFFI